MHAHPLAARLVAVASLLLPLTAAGREPVLLPDFTPQTTSEFGLAFMLQEEVGRALEEAGYLVIESGPAEQLLGVSLESCADVPACPGAYMQDLPARIAVVVRVERRSGDLVGIVAMHAEREVDPIDVWEIPVHPGHEYQFGQAVLGATNTLSSGLGAPPADQLARALEIFAPSEEPAASPAEPELVDLRYAAGSRAQLEASGMELDEWLAETRSHAGRWVVELGGGLGMGDVSRSADVHVAVDEQLDVEQSWFQEGPAAGAGPRLSLSLGYAPLTWLELGVAGGLQLGGRSVGTSWSRQGVVQEQGQADAGAAQLLIIPRMRAYIPPTGIAKPFLQAGAELRFFDAYNIASEGFSYPEPPGGLVPAPMLGAGWLVDPLTALGVLIEASFAYHLGLRGGYAEDGRLPVSRPPADAHGRFTVGLGLGLQLRL